MEALLDWGIKTILWVQQFSPTLDLPFKVFTQNLFIAFFGMGWWVSGVRSAPHGSLSSCDWQALNHSASRQNQSLLFSLQYSTQGAEKLERTVLFNRHCIIIGKKALPIERKYGRLSPLTTHSYLISIGYRKRHKGKSTVLFCQRSGSGED
jgi:hypothetical protein